MLMCSCAHVRISTTVTSTDAAAVIISSLSTPVTCIVISSEERMQDAASFDLMISK